MASKKSKMNSKTSIVVIPVVNAQYSKYIPSGVARQNAIITKQPLSSSSSGLVGALNKIGAVIAEKYSIVCAQRTEAILPMTKFPLYET